MEREYKTINSQKLNVNAIITGMNIQKSALNQQTKGVNLMKIASIQKCGVKLNDKSLQCFLDFQTTACTTTNS